MKIKNLLTETFTNLISGQPFNLKVIITFIISAFSLACINYFSKLSNSLIFINQIGFGGSLSNLTEKITSYPDFQLLDLIY